MLYNGINDENEDQNKIIPKYEHNIFILCTCRCILCINFYFPDLKRKISERITNIVYLPKNPQTPLDIN